MRTIFWDAMILIYLLEGDPQYKVRARILLEQAYERDDRLITSCLGLGEVMAGAGRLPARISADAIRSMIDKMGFSYLPFTDEAVNVFSWLRSVHRVKAPDAIHLACAAAAHIDLFLTNDDKLPKLHVPGIKFIAHFNTSLL